MRAFRKVSEEETRESERSGICERLNDMQQQRKAMSLNG